MSNDMPTGKAGSGDGSLYAGDFDHIEDCWGDVPDELFNLLDRLSTELAELRERIQQLEAKQALINHFHRGG